MYNSIFEDTMANMNWKQIEEKGMENAPVLFPIGVIEEHGPHLPLGTDIYYSYAVSRKIKMILDQENIDCLIAPPFYWGINHCTGSFPGSFSVTTDTMKMILNDLFGNLHKFGFNQVYCINYHGDEMHILTILESIKSANEKYGMHIRLLMEMYDIQRFNLKGNEDYILINGADYPKELFELFETDDKSDLYDIHAGAFETSVMEYFYPDLVDKELAMKLPSYSLSETGIRQWSMGGEKVRDIVPLGYAGNPSEFIGKKDCIDKTMNILSKYYAKCIIELKNSMKD